MRRIEIRQITPGDVDAVLAIQAASPEAAAWRRPDYEAILTGSTPHRCLIAALEGEPTGFACFRVITTEAELLNLAVLPDHRRMGIGAQLVEAFIEAAARFSATDIFLEVRESNAAALSLYKQYGFEVSQRRPGYYSNPSGDALTLRLLLPLPRSLK